MLQSMRCCLPNHAATIVLPFLLLSAMAVSPGCNKLTRENYDKIQPGMTVQQVQDILGKPDETSSGGAEVLGVGGTAATMTWRSGNKSVTVTFVNDKVVHTAMSNL